MRPASHLVLLQLTHRTPFVKPPLNRSPKVSTCTPLKLQVPSSSSSQSTTRRSAASSLAVLTVADVSALIQVKELQPAYDQFGMVIESSLSVEDPWRTRVALGTTLKLISDHFSPADVEAFFGLLIQGEALGDRSQAVRSEMLDVGRSSL